MQNLSQAIHGRLIMIKTTLVGLILILCFAAFACNQNANASYCQNGTLALTIEDQTIDYCADDTVPATRTESVFFKNTKTQPLHLIFRVKPKSNEPNQAEAETETEPTRLTQFIQDMTQNSNILLILNANQAGEVLSPDIFFSLQQDQQFLFHSPKHEDTTLDVTLSLLGKDKGQSIEGNLEGLINTTKKDFPVEISGTFSTIYHGATQPSMKVSLK